MPVKKYFNAFHLKQHTSYASCDTVVAPSQTALIWTLTGFPKGDNNLTLGEFTLTETTENRTCSVGLYIRRYLQKYICQIIFWQTSIPFHV